ncbi:hypothetical protein Ciccas_010406 [Cichlidogyrus casuarinus]|uniref:Uncharacterized protein n=1 Tax=Cichlidogyrus casuarinus TaxID=1844966 RepID=A0ABD2PUS5_9PLAT
MQQPILTHYNHHPASDFFVSLMQRKFFFKYRYDDSELQCENGDFEPPKASLAPYQLVNLLKRNPGKFNRKIVSNFARLSTKQNEVYWPLMQAGLLSYIEWVLLNEELSDEDIELTLNELKRFAETCHFVIYLLPDYLINLFCENSSRSQKTKELAMSVFFLIKRMSERFGRCRDPYLLTPAVLNVVKNCTDLATNEQVLYSVGFFLVKSVACLSATSKDSVLENLMELLALCYKHLLGECCSKLHRHSLSIKKMSKPERVSAALIKLYGYLHSSNIFFKTKRDLLNEISSNFPAVVAHDFQNRRSLLMDHDLISCGPRGRNLSQAFEEGAVSIPCLMRAIQLSQNDELFIDYTLASMFDQHLKTRKCLLHRTNFLTLHTRDDHNESYDYYSELDDSYSDEFYSGSSNDSDGYSYSGPQSELNGAHSLYKNSCEHVHQYYCVEQNNLQLLYSHLTKTPVPRHQYNVDMDQFAKESNLTIGLLLLNLKVETLNRQEQRSYLRRQLLDAVLEFNPWTFVLARNYSQEIRIMFAMLQHEEGHSLAGELYERYSLLTEFAQYFCKMTNFRSKHECCFKFATPYFYQLPE